jgi:hypothetical protein
MDLISMSDTTIIWGAMSVIINNDHPVLYQYIKGRVKSRESVIIRLTNIITPIFIGGYDDAKVRSVSIAFLKQKELDYTNGLIKISPIYSGH